ncbi:MAG: hypothetical protein HY744_18315 [Deltaproteobacteria bacterium]|nr:hypothetical protein [Deltaproteobacteria bacterium]
MKPKTAKPKKKLAARESRERLLAEQRNKLAGAPDPFSRQNVRKVALRVGIPLAVVWVVTLAIPGWIARAAAGVVTLALVAIVVWVYRLTRKSRKVADIVRSADSAEARQEAIGKLDSEYKRGDTAATFAKAQLQMQSDPRAALATLESIDVKKVMAPVADEARTQRAMIHLLLGETDEARALGDAVDLSRHKEPKARAMMAAVIGEAWARTGQASKAASLLETFDANDEIYADLRPQLLRSLCFAYAWSSRTKQMKQALRRLAQIDVQYLAGFVTRKKLPTGVAPRGVHPLLEKEALSMVLRSGAAQRKVQFKRG